MPLKWIYIEDQIGAISDFENAVKSADLYPVPEIVSFINAMDFKKTYLGKDLKVYQNVECFIFDEVLSEGNRGSLIINEMVERFKKNMKLARPIYLLTDQPAGIASPSKIPNTDIRAFRGQIYPKSLPDTNSDPKDLPKSQEIHLQEVVKHIDGYNKHPVVRRWLEELGPNSKNRVRVSLLLTSDYHYGELSKVAKLDIMVEDTRKKYTYQTLFSERLTNTCERRSGHLRNLFEDELNNIDMVVCLGDLISSPEKWSGKPPEFGVYRKTQTQLYLDTLKLPAWLHAVVPGNHDSPREAANEKEAQKFKNYFYNAISVPKRKTRDKGDSGFYVLTPRGIGRSLIEPETLKCDVSRLECEAVFETRKEEPSACLALFSIKNSSMGGIAFLLLDIYGYAARDRNLDPSKGYVRLFPENYSRTVRKLLNDVNEKAGNCGWGQIWKNSLRLVVSHEPFANIRAIQGRFYGDRALRDWHLHNVLLDHKFIGLLCGHMHTYHHQHSKTKVKRPGDGSEPIVFEPGIFTVVVPTISALDCHHRRGYCVANVDVILPDEINAIPKYEVKFVKRYLNKWGAGYEPKLDSETFTVKYTKDN